MRQKIIDPVPYREQLEIQIVHLEKKLEQAYSDFKQMKGDHPDWFDQCSKINNLSVDIESARTRLESLGTRRYLPDMTNISDFLNF